MIKFLRKKAVVIGWIIVLTFVGTMFTGSWFMRDYFKNQNKMAQSEEKKLKNYENEIAVFGKTPVSKSYFSNYLRDMLVQMQQKNNSPDISPEVLEILYLNAFSKSLQYSVFLKGAKENKFKVSRMEINNELYNLYRQFDVKGNKELKELLKKNNYPYKQFIRNLKEEVLAQKFVNLLVSQVQVTDRDVENSNLELNARHILVAFVQPKEAKKDVARNAEKEVLDKITQIEKEILGGLSFSEAAKKYSDDPGSKLQGGSLGWFQMGQMVTEFENVAYALEQGEISKPVKTRYGYHLIKLTDKKPIKTIGFNFEEQKKNLIQARRSQIINAYLQTQMKDLQIIDPTLLAIEAKRTGQIDKALDLYQTQISKMPENPVPHYLRAKLFLAKNDILMAKDELSRALIKVELNQRTDFTELHLELGNIYKQEKDLISMKQEYEKAFVLASGNIQALSSLQEAYKKNNDLNNAKKMELMIKNIEFEQMQKQQQAQKAPQVL